MSSLCVRCVRAARVSVFALREEMLTAALRFFFYDFAALRSSVAIHIALVSSRPCSNPSFIHSKCSLWHLLSAHCSISLFGIRDDSPALPWSNEPMTLLTQAVLFIFLAIWIPNKMERLTKLIRLNCFWLNESSARSFSSLSSNFGNIYRNNGCQTCVYTRRSICDYDNVEDPFL